MILNRGAVEPLGAAKIYFHGYFKQIRIVMVPQNQFIPVSGRRETFWVTKVTVEPKRLRTISLDIL